MYVYDKVHSALRLKYQRMKKNDPRTERLVTVGTAQDQHNLHAPPPLPPCHDVTNE